MTQGQKLKFLGYKRGSVAVVTSSPAVTRHKILPDPALVNLHVAYQAAVLDANTGSISFTNGADAIVTANP